MYVFLHVTEMVWPLAKDTLRRYAGDSTTSCREGDNLIGLWAWRILLDVFFFIIA